MYGYSSMEAGTNILSSTHPFPPRTHFRTSSGIAFFFYVVLFGYWETEIKRNMWRGILKNPCIPTAPTGLSRNSFSWLNFGWVLEIRE